MEIKEILEVKEQITTKICADCNELKASIENAIAEIRSILEARKLANIEQPNIEVVEKVSIVENVEEENKEENVEEKEPQDVKNVEAQTHEQPKTKSGFVMINNTGRPQNKPFDPNRNNQQKPPFNKPGFNKKPISMPVPPPVIDKEDSRRQGPQKKKVEEKQKAGLNKKELFKRGYEYDVSRESYDDDSLVRVKVKKDKKQDTIKKIEITEAVITVDPVPLKVFSEKIGRPAAELVKKCFDIGKMININSSISFEEAELIASDYNITLTLKLEKSAEDKLVEMVNTVSEDKSKLSKRPPVVTIMGHVDHGKTSLLDYIRKSNVIATEAGGITQHIGAYTIDVNGDKITFLDTPGHEAFTAMRKRGAQATDIAIIVIAADDTIMPQTIEAISHAKEAGVRIIVAANKIDKTNGDYSKLLQQLPNYDLLPEEWGGDVAVMPISAKTGQGVQDLLERINLEAEMLELKAVTSCPASGTIIEARLDKNIGAVATVLVKNGTLKVKDFLVAGTNICRVRAMTDAQGKIVKEATPSYAVQVQGFQSVPNAGDQFVVVKDEKLAKQVAEERADKERNSMSAVSGTRTLEDYFKDQTPADVKVLPIIIKADVQGSCEAVKQAMLKLSEERAEDMVKIKIIHAGVGAINESDVMLADTTNAIILGFGVRPETKAKAQAEREKIDIRTYKIIYDAIDDINAALSGMVSPSFKETALGTVEIRDLFKITGVGMIAGCYVLDGKIQRNCGYRLLRDNIVIHEGKISSLRRMKDDVKEVGMGYECGVGLDNYNDFKVGDKLETFLLEQEKIDE